MPFEQPGVANIRERKAANEARQRRENNGESHIPSKGTIEYLVWIARQKLTPEQVEEYRRRSQEIDDKLTREAIERHRCSDCGADTLNYSHSFSCKWRGSGF